MSVSAVKDKLQSLANPTIAEHSQRFFKTGKGEYGEGDKFLGIRVPVLRKQVKLFRELSLVDVCRVLQSRFHEERLLALLMLVDRFERADETEQTEIYQLYLRHTDYINNWDLVDSSALQIVGGYLFERERDSLYELVHSVSLWERRIAIIATFYMIRREDFSDTLKLAEILLEDGEDLIHKAVGWMLREVGKRDMDVEQKFLQEYYKNMPRTMLRYAIEKFPEPLRKQYLAGDI